MTTNESDSDDVELTTEQVDLSGYATAHGAAKAFARRVRGMADELGQKPGLEVTLKKREDGEGHPHASERWVVYWDGGPWEWAVELTGGEPVISAEPEVTGFYGSDGFSIEAENAHAVAFYQR